MKVKTLRDILEKLPPNAKVLFQNDSLYEDGYYTVDRVDFTNEETYVNLESDYKTEYSEVI